MSYKRPLAERERALEEAFFHKESERLIEAMKTRSTQEKQLEALSKALGISDLELLKSLLDLGLREANITALILAPLVCVAWADGTLDNGERRIITDAEAALGVEPGTEGAELIDTWLAYRPHESLIDVWAAYVHELCGVLDSDAFKRLGEDTMERSSRIATAIKKSFLRGGGPTDSEQAVLRKIESAFSKGAEG